MRNRKAIIFVRENRCGILEEMPDGFSFIYDTDYLSNSSLPAVSLTLPKRAAPYIAKELFPFFYGLLAEGVNKDMQCRQLKIDERDFFTRLVKTANQDTIGAVTAKLMDDAE